MGDRPIYDPFLGAGMGDLDPQTLPLANPYGISKPSLTFYSGHLEAEAGNDEVPPLVGDQFSDAPSPPLIPDLECQNDIADVRQALESLMVPAATLQSVGVSKKSFVSLSALQTWFDAPETRKLCGLEEDHLAVPKTKFHKVFAILVLIGKHSSFSDLLANEFNDDYLPLVQLLAPGGNLQVQSAKRPGVPCGVFERWDEQDIASFLSKQWEFISPTLGNPLSTQVMLRSIVAASPFERRTRRGDRRPTQVSGFLSFMDNHVPFFDLPDFEARPFTLPDRFNSGAFGTVFRVQVHESHGPIASTPSKPQPSDVLTEFAVKSLNTANQGSLSIRERLACACFKRDPCYYLDGCQTRSVNRISDIRQHISRIHGSSHFAVKQLHSGNRHAFEKEVQALRLLNSKPHRHIVPLLGSYRLRDRYHLMFPWADSDLGMFWRLNPRPQRDQATASWLVKQVMGLVDALSLIHDSRRNDGDSGDKICWRGRHGDIKPSNILYFGNGSSGILKLADFGLSSFYTPGTPDHEQVEEGPIRYTPAYRAPEFALPGNCIGQRSDIWSFGCVIKEFVTWYLLGASGLEQLVSCRTDDPEQRVRTGDAFFELIGESGRIVARLKPRIGDWITRLQNHRHSSRFTDHVLCLVLDKMLVIESTRRYSARDVLREIARICQDVDNDDSCVTPREARGLAFVDEGDGDASGYLNLSDKDHKKVHSSTQSGHRSNRKRKGNSDTTGSDQDQTTASSGKRHHQRKFGCPYLKAGYPRSELSRACMGPGWGSIHHYKEHLFRCHAPNAFKNPLICGRCLEGFKSQDLVVQHLQGKPQCLIKSPEIINGKVSLEQAINLRSMKRKRPDMTEEDMWFEIYQILFPSKELPTSPYHEDLTVSSLNTISTQSSTGISEYKDHLRRPMSENEQLALGEKLGNRVGISNPEICKMLGAAFREQQLKDIQEFDRQKLEPVYGIPVLDDDAPKTEVANLEAQVGGAGPSNGEDDGDSEWWMKGFSTGEPVFDA